jgi:hypothetical protein
LQKFSNLFKKSGKAVQKTSAAFESSGDKITKNSKKMSKGFKSINFGQLAGAALVMLAFAGSI